VVVAVVKSERREVLEHVTRMFKLFDSSAHELDARTQREKERVTRLSRRVIALESEICRIRAGRP
jgi:hypothetical protein